MAYKRFFIFVEGADDRRFANRVLTPLLKKEYDDVAIVMYAEMKTEKIAAFIDSVNAMGADYVFTADLDELGCPVRKRDALKKRLSGLDWAKIAVVIREIEGWYLAGSHFAEGRAVDEMSKEDVLALAPARMSPVEFLIELLESFDLTKALANSDSLKYFYGNYIPQPVTSS